MRIRVAHTPDGCLLGRRRKALGHREGASPTPTFSWAGGACRRRAIAGLVRDVEPASAPSRSGAKALPSPRNTPIMPQHIWESRDPSGRTLATATKAFALARNNGRRKRNILSCAPERTRRRPRGALRRNGSPAVATGRRPVCVEKGRSAGTDPLHATQMWPTPAKKRHESSQCWSRQDNALAMWAKVGRCRPMLVGSGPHLTRVRLNSGHDRPNSPKFGPNRVKFGRTFRLLVGCWPKLGQSARKSGKRMVEPEDTSPLARNLGY